MSSSLIFLRFLTALGTGDAICLLIGNWMKCRLSWKYKISLRVNAVWFNKHATVWFNKHATVWFNKHATNDEVRRSSLSKRVQLTLDCSFYTLIYSEDDLLQSAIRSHVYCITLWLRWFSTTCKREYILQGLHTKNQKKN